jgi:hypothetical protein
MPGGFESLLKALGQRDLITPYFEAGMLADNWPPYYDIRIDSRPYYGAGDGYFHPSTHPMMGERQLYYIFHPDYADELAFERNSVQRQMTLAMGSALHGVIQTQMEMCKLVTREDIEVEYINRAHHVRGRIDWVTNHPSVGRLPVEFKTRTHFKWARQEAPEPSWVAQLNLGLDSQDCDLGVLLMAESGFPYRLREFHIKRDRQLLDGIYEKFDRVREAIRNNEPPRHCCGPGDKKTIDACPARFCCWLADEAPLGGRHG